MCPLSHPFAQHERMNDAWRMWRYWICLNWNLNQNDRRFLLSFPFPLVNSLCRIADSWSLRFEPIYSNSILNRMSVVINEYTQCWRVINLHDEDVAWKGVTPHDDDDGVLFVQFTNSQLSWNNWNDFRIGTNTKFYPFCALNILSTRLCRNWCLDNLMKGLRVYTRLGSGTPNLHFHRSACAWCRRVGTSDTLKDIVNRIKFVC